MLPDVEFDYTELRKLILFKLGSNKVLADMLGISEVSFSRKINGKVAFSHQDIVKIAGILEIEPESIGYYFFTKLD